MDPGLEERVREAAAVLRSGGVVVYPTETFYGLGALATDPGAVARLVRAKGRPDGKPLPLIAADVAAVREVAILEPRAARLAARFWPGPVTLVVPARPGLPDAITAGTGTVGIRVPGDEVARAIARAAGGAIVATSANPSGSPPTASAGALAPELRDRIDLVVDAGPVPGGLPTTVVAVDEDGLRLLRAGSVSFDQIFSER